MVHQDLDIRLGQLLNGLTRNLTDKYIRLISNTDSSGLIDEMAEFLTIERRLLSVRSSTARISSQLERPCTSHQKRVEQLTLNNFKKFYFLLKEVLDM